MGYAPMVGSTRSQRSPKMVSCASISTVLPTVAFIKQCVAGVMLTVVTASTYPQRNGQPGRQRVHVLVPSRLHAGAVRTVNLALNAQSAKVS